jgi:hypothetical protein
VSSRGLDPGAGLPGEIARSGRLEGGEGQRQGEAGLRQILRKELGAHAEIEGELEPLAVLRALAAGQLALRQPGQDMDLHPVVRLLSEPMEGALKGAPGLVEPAGPAIPFSEVSQRLRLPGRGSSARIALNLHAGRGGERRGACRLVVWSNGAASDIHSARRPSPFIDATRARI